MQDRESVEQGDAFDPARDAGAGASQDVDDDAGLAAASGIAASGVSGLGVQRGETDDSAADLDRDTTGQDVETGSDRDLRSALEGNEQIDVRPEVRDSD